jgi:hypothetical protein
MREKAESENARAQKQQGKIPIDDKSMDLEDLPRRTSMDPQGLVQRIVERGSVVSKLLPQRLLGPGPR